MIESNSNRSGYLGFPDYEQKEHESPYIVEIQILNEADMKKFAEIVGSETILEDGIRSAKSIWYPLLGDGERGGNSCYIWIEA